jgi:glucose/arabinose dehydrogenase
VGQRTVHLVAGALVAFIVLAVVLIGGAGQAAAHGPEDFVFVEVLSDLDRPVGVEVASATGEVFVIEKNGKVKVFDSFDDPTADIVANWEWRVMSTGDQGMLGLAVDPDYGSGTGNDFVYVHYVLDEVPGENEPPHWGDNCPVAQTDGCVVTATLARIEVDPATNTMLGSTDLLTSTACLQFNGHSSNDLAFGPDGYLYASIGDGASYIVADYGQLGGNPCQDPPYPAEPTPANSEGGALRTMDILTSVGGEANDPVWYNGVVLRVDPDTGAAAPGNPLSGGTVTGDDRVIAHGLRNPYRIDFRPGTDELWVADVGWGAFEEINVVADVDDGVVENFGWPCYEGPQLHAVYSQYGMCQTLINNPSSLDLTTTLTNAHFPYDHDDAVGACPGGSSAVAALAFVPLTGHPYPAEYDGALFFTDYARTCLWAMLADANGVPDPSTIETVASGVVIVDLDVTPDGELLIVEVGDFSNGSGGVRRLEFLGQNVPPTAVIEANTLTGTENETEFVFDGSSSTDPEGGALDYDWDLDGDGTFDAAGPVASIIYTEPGSYEVKLRVTDPEGVFGETTVTANVSNTPPVPTITGPTGSETWQVGDEIAFSATATDAEDGGLAPDTPGQEWQWVLTLHHCPGFDCHEHVEGNWVGVSGGTIVAPDHEFPAWLELTLTVYDSTGASGQTSVEIHPRTSLITLATEPPGLELAAGVSAQPQTTPFVIEAIEGGDVSIVGPTPQVLGSTTWAFDAWSDGGARIHDIVTPTGDTTITAAYQPVIAGFADDWTGLAPSGGWSYWWNESGPLGSPGGYSALAWNGSFYDSDGLPGQPSADEFAYGSIRAGPVHPGRGTRQGTADDRYAIIRYQVPAEADYAIVGSEVNDADCPTGGVEVAVLVNDVIVSSQIYAGAGSFDQSLGVLSAGDAIEVAVGPAGSDGCDSTAIDFFISQSETSDQTIVATFGDDFNPGDPTGGWSYLWNETGPLGQSSGYTPLQWNSVYYDSDGVLSGPSADEFSYGRVADWGVHPGRSTSQGSADDRDAIVRYTVTSAGDYAIVDSLVMDRGCASGGVEVTVLVDDAVVSTLAHVGAGAGAFDVGLGTLAAGSTIDVAIGPGADDQCDSVDLDFSLAHTPAEPGVVTATFSTDFTGPAPTSAWGYFWNENGPIGDSSGYTPLQWNTVHYDSDGLLGGQTGDDFTYGLVAKWGVHPGRGIDQGTTDERYAIIRHTVTSADSYSITSSFLENRGCATGGVEVMVLVNDTPVSSWSYDGGAPISFDVGLGTLAAGDTIDVAVGPDGVHVCDAVDLDFSIMRGGGGPPPTPEVVGTFSDHRDESAPADGWTFWWNESGAVGDPAGYSLLLWNGTYWDSDGIPGSPSADQFAYGRVASWGVHPGKGTRQGTPVERAVIVRYTATAPGEFDIVDSLISDIHCASSTGVGLEVLVNDVTVFSATHVGATPADFDQTLGTMAVGDTVDVAVSPGVTDVCDAIALDFTLERLPPG